MQGLPLIGANAFNAYGMMPAQLDRQPLSAPLAGSAATPIVFDVPAWSPDSPLFWFAGLLLVTAGLIGLSTSARFGPVRGSISVGES